MIMRGGAVTFPVNTGARGVLSAKGIREALASWRGQRKDLEVLSCFFFFVLRHPVPVCRDSACAFGYRGEGMAWTSRCPLLCTWHEWDQKKATLLAAKRPIFLHRNLGSPFSAPICPDTWTSTTPILLEIFQNGVCVCTGVGVLMV